MQILAIIAALLALVGVIQQFIGTMLIERFCAAPVKPPKARPPVTVLKPLCGVEPMTEIALESFFTLDYPQYQLVFGVQNPQDPVLTVLAALRDRYQQCDVAVMINDTQHGSNRKVSNLINMLPLAKYDTLVASDADIHVPPEFLDRVVKALEEPDVGLVTTLYTGLPGTPGLPGLLGACQINFAFLPGALLARKLGRQDCLGVTMALSKATLAKIGGFQSVANNLADDQVLGRHVLAAGYKLSLAQAIPVTTVPEANFKALYRHELRWARTIRALVPLAYAGSILQIPLLWALLAVLFSGFEWWSLLLFLAVPLLRFLAAQRIKSVLQLSRTGDAWLFLLRDVFSTIIYIASFTGSGVDWRGQSMTADSGRLDAG